MDERPAERKLAAILSADVEGYSRLMGEDELGTVRAITESREVIGASVARHGGRVAGPPGAKPPAELASAGDALPAAVASPRPPPAPQASRAPRPRRRVLYGVYPG